MAMVHEPTSLATSPSVFRGDGPNELVRVLVPDYIVSGSDS